LSGVEITLFLLCRRVRFWIADQNSISGSGGILAKRNRFCW
jgi:hypothetical protein